MTESQPKRTNRPLLIIIAIAVLTTAIPYLMYYTGLGVPAETTNQGILVQEPFVLSEFEFRDEAGQAWALNEQNPKFRLILPVRGPCDESCRETLYLTRQVHTRLSKDAEQLERVYVQLGEPADTEFRAYLKEEHPRLRYLTGNPQEWQEAFSTRPELSPEFDGTEYYLLHRYGALSMAYNEQHSGNQLLDDLEFLIKTSN